MCGVKITNSILYVGVDDKDLDLFESQYIIPNGISYNSYVIMDEKIAIMDTVDARKTEEWISNVDAALAGKEHWESDRKISGTAGGWKCKDFCYDSTIL